jgi:adenosine deaminase
MIRTGRSPSPWSLAALVLAAALAAPAQARPAGTPAAREAQVGRLMQQASASPTQLRAFLQRMPKGADLHNHAGGSVYAEDFLRWADEDGWCVDGDHALRPPPCRPDQVPARGLGARDPALYAQVVDALSMRNFLPSAQQPSGHDRFFATFGKFGAISRARRADGIVATLEQAARDQVGYVELILNPDQSDVLGRHMQAAAWDAADPAADLARIAPELPALVRAAREDTDRTDAQVRRLMRCGQPDASPGCQVEYRYLAYVLRTLPQPSVFGQMALNYALVAADPRYVGVNIVAPEDAPVARADYRAHMAMFRFFSSRYPQVQLSLHAGELAPGLVPPADLRFHIREAVAAGAARIGHGTDLAHEDAPQALLRTMRTRQVAVEVNLTSNDQILGVRGGAHPLAMYLAAGVPVVLSTDDEGVSRGDMTGEYQRAVTEHGLDYAALKRIARNGLSHAFLPGASLWQADGNPVPACAPALAAWQAPPPACRALLQASPRAGLQWRLEEQFARFEDAVLQEEPAA